MKAGQIKLYLLLTTLFLTSGSIPLFSQSNRFQNLKGRRIAKAPEGEKAMLRRGGFLLAQADPKAGENKENAGEKAPAAQEKAPAKTEAPAPAAPKAPADIQAGEKTPAGEKPAAAEPQDAPAAEPAKTPVGEEPKAPVIQPEKKTPVAGEAPEAKAGAITIEPSGENKQEFTPNAKYLNQRVDIHEGQIPLDDFLRFLADFTGLTVILSGGPAGASARQGQMINITAPIYLADFEIVKAVLDANGFQLVRRKLSTGKEIITISSTATSQAQGGVKENPVIKVGASGATQMDSQLKKGDLGLSSDELATMVVQLDHVAPADAILSLNTLATGTQSKGSTRNSGFNVAEVKGTQTIIVTAKFGLLDYIVKLLKIIDVEQKNPERIVHIIEAKEADAQELVSLIESFLQQNRAGRTPSRTTTRPTTSTSSASRSSSSLLRGGAAEFETSLIADPRTQKIIITTYTMADLEDINML
ncbi:MAG: hypothetical protein MK138_07790, partial [Planctomycetes bacterium]|nr:hypothetical protein [Planctomycetota bacterium]